MVKPVCAGRRDGRAGLVEGGGGLEAAEGSPFDACAIPYAHDTFAEDPWLLATACACVCRFGGLACDEL